MITNLKVVPRHCAMLGGLGGQGTGHGNGLLNHTSGNSHVEAPVPRRHRVRLLHEAEDDPQTHNGHAISTLASTAMRDQPPEKIKIINQVLGTAQARDGHPRPSRHL